MVEPRYEPCAEDAGIHGNPESAEILTREVRQQKHTTGTNGNQRETAHSYTGSNQNKEALQNPV